MFRWRWYHILLLFLAIKFTVHVYTNTLWPFHRDELLYLSLSNHLDWGYASVPPQIGFWAWIGTNLLGGEEFGTRLISTLFITSSLIITVLMALSKIKNSFPHLSGNITTLLIAIAGITCGIFLRPALLFQPVGLDLFYWTLLCFIIVKKKSCI